MNINLNQKSWNNLEITSSKPWVPINTFMYKKSHYLILVFQFVCFSERSEALKADIYWGYLKSQDRIKERKWQIAFKVCKQAWPHMHIIISDCIRQSKQFDMTVIKFLGLSLQQNRSKLKFWCEKSEWNFKQEHCKQSPMLKCSIPHVQFYFLPRQQQSL